jgi:hypothetical protein
MDSRTAAHPQLPLGRLLTVSLVVTALATGCLCAPPPHPLHSWTAIASLATAYMLLAASVHTLAVWSVCRIREEGASASRPLLLSAIWAAWLVVVWLPLLALLTAEHSPWVALILPVTSIFALLLLRWRGSSARTLEQAKHEIPAGTLFRSQREQPLWLALLPAVAAALLAEGGMALLAADHAWLAGCLFATGVVYPIKRWTALAAEHAAHPRSASRASAGNSVLVWLLLLLALTPFLASYAVSEWSRVLGVSAATGSRTPAPSHGHGAAHGYLGLILLTPPKPHVLVAPVPLDSSLTLGKPKVIEFDGAYLYYQEPATGPGPDAHVMRGDPVKNRIRSTDDLPLSMEAHQRLGQEFPMSCCRSLRVDVTNADTVAGPIAMEVLLRDSRSGHASPVSLGTMLLPSSRVSPMPLKRPAVADSVTFRLPPGARGRSFNEIIVRIQPGRLRALAGAKVAIDDFTLQP